MNKKEIRVGQQSCSLYNEDCFVAFDIIEDSSVDLILCDLPYG